MKDFKQFINKHQTGVFVVVMLILAVLYLYLARFEADLSLCKVLKELIGYAFGGSIGSFIIAKKVINPDVERNINNLNRFKGSVENYVKRVVENTKPQLDDWKKRKNEKETTSSTLDDIFPSALKKANKHTKE